MIKHIIALAILGILNFNSFAKDAIIELDSTAYTFINSKKVIATIKKRITILNKNADKHAIFEHVYSEKLEKIKSTKVYIYRNNKKIKVGSKYILERKIQTSGFIDDSRYIYYKPVIKTYPYTIEWECIYETNPFLENEWAPLFIENATLQKSWLTITVSTDSTLKYQINPIKTIKDSIVLNKNNTKTYIWKYSNESPILLNNFTNSILSFRPYIRFNFEPTYFFNHTVSYKNWKEYGQVFYTLYSGKQNLSEESKKFFVNLVSGTTDTLEKIKIAYNYLQKNTRYVSIQLNTGGWIPFSADFVDKKKYGDCKALSNYMVSILDAMNIKAYCAFIYSNDEDFIPISNSFVSNSFNHVIVTIPLAKDTLWLECTDNISPFNNIHRGIENRYALVLKNNNSEIIKTPLQSELINKRIYNIHINNITSKQAIADFSISYYGINYINISNSLTSPNQTAKEIIQRSFSLEQHEILSYSTTQTDSCATLNFKAKINTNEYLGDNYILLPTLFFNNITDDIPDSTTIGFKNLSNNKIEFNTIIDVPNASTITLPDNKKLESEYGEYSLIYKKEKNKIMITRELIERPYICEQNKYTQFSSFITRVNKFDLQAIQIDLK